MKKTLLLLASVALLLVGCQKEKFAEEQVGGLTEVTFTASLESGVATKAAVDGDGAAASVNRCIMEIYYGDELFTRMYSVVDANKRANFVTQLVSNRTYTVAFWADHVEQTTEAGLQIDNYYDTRSANGLKAVALKGTYAGNIDARDAFALCKEYTIAQAGSAFTATLKRPFAQINVITTDVATVAKVSSLKPEKVNVVLKNATKVYNVLDSTAVAGSIANLTYTANIYNWDATKTECTLSMDYIFAEKEKGTIDIDWKARKTGEADVEHAFSAIPYQRNYRTNIKGALLTTQGQWTVEVYPIWETDTNGDFDYAYTSVFDIQGANDFVAQNQDKKEISVTFSTQPNDAGDPSEGTDEHPINAIVTSLLKEGATYNIDVASTTDVLYVGDYDYTTTATGTTYDYTVVLGETSGRTNAAAVNLVVTDNLYIGTLVVNSPSKSVSINGQTLESGHSYHIDNLVVEEVSLHTVIIEKGMSVENLTMVKGGLEIHGTVNQAIVPDDTPIEDINVRDCENLDETLVYNVLKEYIAEGYVGVKGRTTADKWDIIPTVCKIGTKSYGSLIDAVAAVQSGETINLVRDYEGDGVVVEGGKNFTLDFGGHTYKVIGNLAGSAGTKNQCFQLLKGSTLTFQNGTITTSCAKLGINTYSDLTIKDLTIDMSGTDATGQVACLETCNGTVSVEGASNLIAKEGQIATLVLYWPNGGYGDISLTMNTTGEVSGLMAYGSYQVPDLSTVAQHSSVTIKNGKYDVTFDMDELENYNYKVTGGVFTAKPDYNLTARGTAFVPNTDAATKDKYPWTIGTKPLPGSGTVADPYQVASAEDLSTIMNYSDPSTHFVLTQDLELVKSDCLYTTSYEERAITNRIYGTFDGGGHKLTFPNDDNCYTVASYMMGGTIKNLDIEFKEDGVVAYQNYYGATFDNVNVSGKLLHFSGNCGAYIIYNWDNLVMENCICSADITGTGGDKDYNAVFVGYDMCGTYGGTMSFKNCKYTGKMICGRSALFIGNPCVNSVNLTVENCSNDGSITSTYVSNEYLMNYYYAITSNNNGHFILNGVDHPGVASNGGQSWVPKCWEDQLITGTGTTVNGPIDSGMAITKNGDNQFVITPATGGQVGGVTVAKYTVYSGLYVGLVNNSGSGRSFATEDITPDGSTSHATNMKDYKFVDHTYLNGGAVTKVGDNDTYTNDSGTYYVVGTNYSTGGQPKPATIHYVAAYDAQGILLASVSME